MTQERQEREPQPQRKRVIFEMDNGTLRYIEGEDVVRYTRAEGDITMMSKLHHGPVWPKLSWKEIPTSEAATLFTRQRTGEGNTNP